MRTRKLAAAIGIGFSALVVALVWWQTEVNPSIATARVPDILREFRETWLFDRVISDVVPSVVRMTAGFWVAVILGVSVGIAIGWSPILRQLIQPILIFMRNLSPAALIPPALVLLGIGDLSKIFLIAFVCVWPVLINTADGVRQIDPTAMATARAYGLSGGERLRHLVLPAVGPRIFAGAQTALAFSLLLMVASELYASTSGIGFFVAQTQVILDIDAMWAGILLLGLIGVTLNILFEIIQRRALRWHFATSGSSSA